MSTTYRPGRKDFASNFENAFVISSEQRVMKPINVYPMVILLICVILLVIWLRPS
jgi:hypothetical protein